jgi:hypothetical protein
MHSDTAPLYSPFDLRISSYWLSVIATVLCLACQLAATIYLAVIHEYHLNMYTYWSYTFETAFYVGLLAALLHQHMLLTALVIYALPIVLGNAVFVMIAIIIIIYNNGKLYIKGSVCAVPPGDLSMAALHTGDWEIHGLTLFRLFMLLLAGVFFFTLKIIIAQGRKWGVVMRWAYFVYWMFTPLSALVLYQWIFDINKLYPTSFTKVQRIFLLGGISIVTQLVFWIIFLQKQNVDQVHVHALPGLDMLKPGHYKEEEHLNEGGKDYNY